MVGRRKQLSADVEKLSVALTPDEQLVLQVIKTRRKKRGAERSSQSQILADGLWKLLTDEEHIPKEDIAKLTDVGPPSKEAIEKVTPIRSKES